ncbi:cytidine deaminase [Marixanthomonas sp. SCSIO 43207]|uniref:cytidine deaminase n=1 Tax=Marixanthomonas sp. SCSIO 43207 TaxID=2779360 RepID=UPI001CA96E57|nr:cytidine deaminase [Marixanthomonas sp. SCSIO 43207]UAB79877.1 cytidine deaminase [Marixanthomonas sp. SCSIO 43207]
MKKQKIEIHLDVFDSVSELPQDIQKLMNKAQEAREDAYAPYSHFRVGAALILNTGEIITGNNQENAAFPSGLCAERVAIFYAGATNPNATIHAMAITARSLKQKITSPIPSCGACRQAIAEYEIKQDAPIAIYFMGETGKIVKASSIADLLPLLFDKNYL